jgi:hypothetical protein
MEIELYKTGNADVEKDFLKMIKNNVKIVVNFVFYVKILKNV